MIVAVVARIDAVLQPGRFQSDCRIVEIGVESVISKAYRVYAKEYSKQKDCMEVLLKRVIWP